MYGLCQQSLPVFYLYFFHGAAGFLRYGNLLSRRFSDNIFLTISTLDEMPLIAFRTLGQSILFPTYLPYSPI